MQKTSGVSPNPIIPPSQNNQNEPPQAKEPSLFWKVVTFPYQVFKLFILKIIDVSKGIASRINSVAQRVFLGKYDSPKEEVRGILKEKDYKLKEFIDSKGTRIELSDSFLKDINRLKSISLNKQPLIVGDNYSKANLEKFFDAFQQTFTKEEFKAIALFLNQNGLVSLNKTVFNEFNGIGPLAHYYEFFVEDLGDKVKIKILADFTLQALQQVNYKGNTFEPGDNVGYLAGVSEIIISKKDLQTDWKDTPVEKIAPEMEVNNRISEILETKQRADEYRRQILN